MGCTASRRPFVVNSKVEGQDQAALNVLTELGLSQRDIDLLYTAFWDMDADSSGTIQPIELFAYFEVESATFEKGVFCLFDEGTFFLFSQCCTM
jgi:Ca2+-binding EF-hand superfamily protein